MSRYAFAVVVECDGDDADEAYEAASLLLDESLRESDVFLAFMSNGREIPAGWAHEGDPSAEDPTTVYLYDVAPPEPVR